MIYRKINLPDSSVSFEFPVENCCPHCGTYNEPVKIKVLTNFSSEVPLKVFAIIFKTTCCNRYFVSFYACQNFNNIKHIFTYPSVKPEILPQELASISPDFVKIFNQSKAAADLGHSELACIGYRTSIEFLLKDFLIKIRKYDADKISKMRLADVISLFEEKEIRISADVVRILGNDKTHYLERYNFDIREVKQYLSILINSVFAEILLANPPVKRK